MRVAGTLLLILASALLLVGLAVHFANHPGELLRPWEVASRFSVVPVVLTHLPEHPTTILGIISVLLFGIGLALSIGRHRSRGTG